MKPNDDAGINMFMIGAMNAEICSAANIPLFANFTRGTGIIDSINVN